MYKESVATNAVDADVVAAEVTYEDKAPKRFCWKCGARIPSGLAFCHRCGQNLSAEVKSGNHENGIRHYFQGWGMWAAIIGVAVVVAAVVAIAIGVYFGKEEQALRSREVGDSRRSDDDQLRLTPSEKLMFERARQQREHPELWWAPVDDGPYIGDLPGLGLDPDLFAPEEKWMMHLGNDNP